MAKTDPATVDAYIAALPPAARSAVGQVRSAIRRALPEAKEVISYRIPAARTDDGIVIWFAGWPTHVSLYPVGDAVEVRLGEDLSRYRRGKATLHFKLSEPMPEALIERIAGVRGRLAAEAKTKRAAARRSAEGRAPSQSRRTR